MAKPIWLSAPLLSTGTPLRAEASPSDGGAPAPQTVSNDLEATLSRAWRNTFALAWGFYLLAGAGLVAQVVAKGPVLWLEVGLTAAIPVTGVGALLTARRQDRQWRKTSPLRVRIFPDRVVGEFEPVPGLRGFSATRALRFQRGMLFFESGGSYGIPRVVVWPPPRGWLDDLAPGDVEQPAIALGLTGANVQSVKKAWEAWKTVSPSSQDQGVPESRPASPEVVRSLAGVPITWVDNRLPDVADRAHSRKLAWGIVVAIELAFLALAEVFLGPLFGPLMALESAYYYLWYFPVMPLAFPAVDYLRRYLGDRPQVGVDGKGVYVARRGRKPRFVPWPRIYGPSRQIFKGNWVMYFGKKDGSFYLWDNVQLGPEAAKLVASHPLCPRRKMIRSDAESLGLLM